MRVDDAEHARDRRDDDEDLDEPVLKLREEDLPEGLGALNLELVGAVDREQLLRARLAQTVLRRDALALEERLHLHRVRRHNFISDRWS